MISRNPWYNSWIWGHIMNHDEIAPKKRYPQNCKVQTWPRGDSPRVPLNLSYFLVGIKSRGPLRKPNRYFLGAFFWGFPFLETTHSYVPNWMGPIQWFDQKITSDDITMDFQNMWEIRFAHILQIKARLNKFTLLWMACSKHPSVLRPPWPSISFPSFSSRLAAV